MNTLYNSVSVLSNCYDHCVSLQISNIKLESIHWAQGRWCETQPPLNWKRINNFGCTLIRVCSLNNTSFYRKSNGQFAPCCLIDIITTAFNKIFIRLKWIKINGFFFHEKRLTRVHGSRQLFQSFDTLEIDIWGCTYMKICKVYRHCILDLYVCDKEIIEITIFLFSLLLRL